ncbi:MAG: hypothetical protein CEE40_01530 [Chloroflexi bacterium B3_Chlor]|nr:MAG: hypothetical protein CEE40_01530 [Chloroflexi bacterium B3_Chlor]
MKKPLIGLGIALAVLAACLLSLIAGGMAGGIIGYVSGRRATRAALPRLWQEFALPREPFDEGQERWRQPPQPWEAPPEEMLRPFADQLGAALVTEVVPDGPADEAGVREGDVIIAVDNKALGELPDLSEVMRRREPGDEVTLTVLRRGDEIEVFEIEVTLGRQRDEEGEIVAYLGIWYQPMEAMIHIIPRSRGPWD